MTDPALTSDAKAAVDSFRDQAINKAKGSEKLAAMERLLQSFGYLRGTHTGHPDVVIRFLDFATSHVFKLRTLFEGRDGDDG